MSNDITTIDSQLGRSLPARAARGVLRKLLRLFEIATVNRLVIEGALASRIGDFEDAVLAASGQVAGVDCIVTRNTKDFAGTSMRVFDPAAFLAQFK